MAGSMDGLFLSVASDVGKWGRGEGRKVGR